MGTVALEINEEVIPTLKFIVKREFEILEKKKKLYEKELAKFEQKYGMTSKQFKEKFKSGIIGDEGEYFDWWFALRAYEHIENKISALKGVHFD